MKFNLFILALLLMQVSMAQVETSKEFSYTVSDPYEVIDAGSRWYFGINDSEVLSLKTIKKGFIAQKYSGSKLNEVKREELPYIPDNTKIEKMLEIEDRIYIFYSMWDKSSSSTKLFVRELDTESAKFKADKNLLTIQGNVSSVGHSQALLKQAFRDKFSISTDYDESKILIQYRKLTNDDRETSDKDQLGLHVFTPQLEETWSHVVTMPYTKKKMNNVGHCLDKDGNVYLLTEVFKDETTKKVTKSGDPNIDLEVIRIDKDDKSLKNTRIELKDKLIKTYNFFEIGTGDIIVAGYYSNDKSMKSSGLYTYALSSEGEVLKSSVNEFDPNVLKQYESAKNQSKIDKADEKGELGVSKLKLRDLVLHKDGSITALGEVHYSETNTNANSQSSSSSTSYYYEEIIACHLNPDGKMTWMSKLPKKQIGSKEYGGLGYKVMLGNESIYLLFLDNIKNLQIEIDKVPKKHIDGRGGYLTAYQVPYSSGKATKLSIFDTKKVNDMELFQFATDRIVSLSDTVFAVEFYKKDKEDVMIRVKLEGN